MRSYTKFWVALAGFAATFAAVAADGSIDGADGSKLLIAAATAIGVFSFANKDAA